MVEENSTVEYPDLQTQVNEADAEEADDGRDQEPQSPALVSNISGTTARNSRSWVRLGSSAEEVVDALPDMLVEAEKILDLLLPRVVDEESVANLLRELQDQGSRKSKALRRYAGAFQVHRDVIGREEKYIDVPATRNAIVGLENQDSGTSSSWRPDNILYKVNLATLLLVITRNWDKSPDLTLIEELEEAFPVQFMSTFPDLPFPAALTGGGSAMLAQTFELARALRVQVTGFVLAERHDEQNFDPEGIIHQCYYSGPNSRIKGWQVPGLRDGDLTQEQQAALRDHVDRLQEIFAEGDDDNLASLREFYPWVTFVTDVMAWAKPRNEEIDVALEHQGGVIDITESLSSRLQSNQRDPADPNIDPVLVNRENPIQLDYPNHSEASRATSVLTDVSRPVANMLPGKTFNTPGNIQHLKQLIANGKQVKMPRQQPRDALRAKHSSVVAESQHGENGPGQAVDEDWVAPEIEDDMPESDIPASVPDAEDFILRAVRGKRREELASNKENIADPAYLEQLQDPQQESSSRQALTTKRSFIDRQQGASRVDFEDTQQAPISLSSSSAQSRKRKGRSRDDNENEEDEDLDDLSQDQGFQTADHPVDITARRRAKPSQNIPKRRATNTRSSKRARIATATDPDQTTPPPPASSSSPQPNPRRPTTSSTPQRPRSQLSHLQTAQTDPAAPSPSSTLSAHQKANTQARILTSLSTAAKPAQQRTPWSVDETETLIALIMSHGISWKTLKQVDEETNGGVLAGRDQVSLKDKARNMKVDFLK